MKTAVFQGKTYKVFTISCFGEEYEVICVPETYSFDNSLAITVLCYEPEYDGWEPFGTLTTNIGDDMLQSADSAFVKNYSENDGWAEKLASEIGEDTGIVGFSGHVQVPLFLFDISKVYA